MKQTVKIFLWSLACLAMTACFRTDETITPSGRDSFVDITFTAVTTANTAAATRALTQETAAEKDENTVDKILVLMFDGSDNYLDVASGTITSQGSGNFRNKTFTAKVKKDSRSFVFLANVDESMVAAAVLAAHPSLNKDVIIGKLPSVDIDDIKNSDDDATEKYLPMWGYHSTGVSEPATSIGDIKLLRMVAAINVKMAAGVGSISEVRLYNGNDKGQIYPNSGTYTISGVSIPSDAARFTQTITCVPTTDFSGRLYAFEADHTVAAPYLVVKLNDGLYYRLNFNSGTDGLSLIRNRKYTFTITSISGTGSANPENAEPNAEWTFKWSDFLGSETIMSSDGYYISVNRSEFAFGYQQVTAPSPENDATYKVSSELIIKTNHPGGLTVASTNIANFKLYGATSGKVDAITTYKARITREKAIRLNRSDDYYAPDVIEDLKGTIKITNGAAANSLELSVDITQYAPVLKFNEAKTRAANTSFPTEGSILSTLARTFTICVDANVAWGAKWYLNDNASPVATSTVNAGGTFVNAAPAVNGAITFNVPAGVASSIQYINIYLYAVGATDLTHSRKGTPPEVKVVRYTRKNLPYASPGVIGYVYNPGGPDHNKLTMRGSIDFEGTLVDTKEFGDLYPGTVYVAFFKWGSLIATDSHTTTFSKDAVVRVPKEYKGKTSFEDALSALKGEISSDTGRDAWLKLLQGPTETTPTDAWKTDLYNGHGDPCAYYFNGDDDDHPGKWRLPNAYIKSMRENDSVHTPEIEYDYTYSWNGNENTVGPFGTTEWSTTTLSWDDLRGESGAQWVSVSTTMPIPGAVAGNCADTPGPDWNMFLPAAGNRMGGDGNDNPGTGALNSQFDNGSYWSDRHSVFTDWPGALIVRSSGQYTGATFSGLVSNYGAAVRCVRDTN